VYEERNYQGPGRQGMEGRNLFVKNS
jgi:hypothetical protein